MPGKPHDIGYLKRVDQGDGWSQLVDWSGKVVATVRTDIVARFSRNLDVRRFRYTETNDC